MGKSEGLLKAIVSIVNSTLATYYLFLISSSIGIEREEIQTKEIYSLPVNYDHDIFNELAKELDNIIDRILENFPMTVDVSDLERQINNVVFKLFSLTSNERVLVEDFMSISVSLLFDGHKSLALKPITISENKSYASFLCKELSDFLSTESQIVNASVFNVKSGNPLNIVKISFASAKENIELFGTDIYEKYLEEINKYSISALAKNIYIQKQLKYFDNNDIYIIKPNQKRFWSRSVAINGGKELINEILKMS